MGIFEPQAVPLSGARLLEEREKELECIYVVDRILNQEAMPLDSVVRELVLAIPAGFYAPGLLCVSLRVGEYRHANMNYIFAKNPSRLPITLDGCEVGNLSVAYRTEALMQGITILESEDRLLDAIARRLEQLLAGRSVRMETDPDAWKTDDMHAGWRWRQFMAQQIAAALDMERLGVRGIYLFGSTDTGDIGIGSDIDLLVHFDGTADQLSRLTCWMDGWGRALAKINFLHTGYDTDTLLDVHIVTDENIRTGNSYALKINSGYEPATPLRVRDDLS